MATPTWIQTNDQIVAANHPIFADKVNLPVIGLNTNLLVGHEQTGFHSARRTGLSGEIGSFAGNATPRTISLSNSGLTPIQVLVWEGPAFSEMVSNGTFDSATTGWTALDLGGGGAPTLSSVAGGVSGNCLQITRYSIFTEMAHQLVSGFTIGKEYRLVLWAKQGNVAGSFTAGLGSSPGAISHLISSGLTTSWVKHTLDFTATATSYYLQLNAVTSGSGGNTNLYDSVSVFEIGGNIPEKIDIMTSDKAQPSRYTSDAWEADLIDNFQAGSFDVGDTGINSSGVTNYYLALGIDEDTVCVGDGGAGSDPTWVPSGTSYKMIADGTATIGSGNYGNNVASFIWTKFLVEHTTAGAHSITLQHKRIETIFWAGNDADNRVISLVLTSLDIDYVTVYADGMPVASKSVDMSGDNTKDEDAAAFAADLIQTITTNGQMTVGTGLNASGTTYMACITGT